MKMTSRKLNSVKHRNAFTLIELLVVIAIIAILAAILFPVFATAREKARQTTCSSNLKQLGIAFLQYEQDYDERTPIGRDGNPGGWWGDAWAYRIFPYVKATAAYTCPDDVTTMHGSEVGDSLCSYAFNTALQATQVPQFTSVAKSVMLCEVTNVQINLVTTGNGGWQQAWGSEMDYSGVTAGFSAGTEGLGVYSTNQPAPYIPTFATGYMGGRGTSDGFVIQANLGPATGRHSNGANYLMADGHVKWLLGNLVSSGRTASNANCLQGGSGTGCNGDGGAAAGTSVSTYAVTFSAL